MATGCNRKCGSRRHVSFQWGWSREIMGWGEPWEQRVKCESVENWLMWLHDTNHGSKPVVYHLQWNISSRRGFLSCSALIFFWVSLVAQTVKDLPAIQQTGVRSLSSEDSPGEGNGNPLQYSYLENSMDRGAWRAAVHGVAQSASVPFVAFTDYQLKS